MNKNKIIHIVKVGPHQQDTVMFTDGVCRCICTGKHNNTNSYLKILVDGRVRKMTTVEIGRLMGLEDFEIQNILDSGLSRGNINSMFGNSIVVNTLSEVFRELFFGEHSDKNVALF